jgi:hypothetical protein
MNLTTTILDIIHSTGFYLKSQSPCLQVEPMQMGPTERASLCLEAPGTTPIWFTKPTQHKPSKTAVCCVGFIHHIGTAVGVWRHPYE